MACFCAVSNCLLVGFRFVGHWQLLSILTFDASFALTSMDRFWDLSSLVEALGWSLKGTSFSFPSFPFPLFFGLKFQNENFKMSPILGSHTRTYVFKCMYRGGFYDLKKNKRQILIIFMLLAKAGAPFKPFLLLEWQHNFQFSEITSTTSKSWSSLL